MNTTPQYYDRYPGARPFGDNKADQRLFFGRDNEIHELFHRILTTDLLVLFGKSGLGKTSLLQAGVFARLRERDLLPLPVRLNDTKRKPMALFFDAIAEQCKGDNIDYTPGETNSLWEFFKTALFLRSDALQTPVLVLDQFEELFSLQDDARRAVIIRELAELNSSRLPENIRKRRRAGEQLPYSDQPPDVKIVFSLREDFLGELQGLIGELPNILEQRFRLTAFADEQAKSALSQPARIDDQTLFSTQPFRYEEEVVKQVLSFLEGTTGFIEPFQLQVLCRHVEQQVSHKQKLGEQDIHVDQSYLGDTRAMQRILQNFYLLAIKSIASRSQSDLARQLCEQELLNRQGQRLSLEKGQIEETYRFTEATLSTLVDTRLLRQEPRLGSFYYEINHDSSAQPAGDRMMAAKPFTSEEWKKINETLKEDPAGFGLPRRRYGSVVLGSFNIRKLGSASKRNEITWKFLAYICAQFDLLAIQEILDDLSGLKHLMELLGPEFGLIISDTTGVFPSKEGLAERLGFVYNRRLVQRTEIATDITYDRTRMLKTLALNREGIVPVMNLYGEYLESIRAWEDGGKQGPRPKTPSKSLLRMPTFLTFIRQPFCVGFKVSGHPGTRPYEFLTVNAHLNYGDPKHDPKQEFYALMDWIVARAGQEGKPYHENFILLGDLNLDFDDPDADKERLGRDIKALNKVTEQGVSVNFPFLDIHPDRNEVFRTNARKTQTYDQIGLFTRDDRLPTYEANETIMGQNPVGPDYGVFNFVDLFQKALNVPDSELTDLFGRFEHKVSDHMPLWLRLPLP